MCGCCHSSLEAREVDCRVVAELDLDAGQLPLGVTRDVDGPEEAVEVEEFIVGRRGSDSGVLTAGATGRAMVPGRKG